MESPGADAPIGTAPAAPASGPEAPGAPIQSDSAPSPSLLGGQSDPLAESPDAVWYVRPASGGQFGPATGDVMRTWIGEGRIGPDSLVWREGWRDWRQAGEVFGQLGSANPHADFTARGANVGASTGAQADGFPPPARGRSTALNAAIVAALILAVVVLLGVFVWVLSRGREPSDGASARAPATVASAVDGPWGAPSWPSAAERRAA